MTNRKYLLKRKWRSGNVIKVKKISNHKTVSEHYKFTSNWLKRLNTNNSVQVEASEEDDAHEKTKAS